MVFYYLPVYNFHIHQLVAQLLHEAPTMANEEEERLLETQLELQLHEQKESLSAIQDALTSDPHNSELLTVQEELVSTIKDAEEGLFHLKRARLLREVDSAVQGSYNGEVEQINSVELDDPKPLSEDAELEPVDPIAVEVEPLEEPSYVIGLKCRFRHTDGRWYNGEILKLEGSSARVSFLTPTSEKMMVYVCRLRLILFELIVSLLLIYMTCHLDVLMVEPEVQMCKFFLQQRCRFGANCRLSHGTLVSLSSLKKYVSPCWGPPFVGASIWAVSGSGARVWREAELECWDDKLNQGQVVFRDDGSSETLGVEAITLSQYAEDSNDEEARESDYSSSENSGSSDYENDGLPQGLGFVESTALQKGIQTDTAIFAEWENHTRGMASKMMANMGYREGMGLGLSGQGMVNPVPVKVLPPKQSLDHALQSVKKDERDKSSEKMKKRSRGGKRKREKKFAEAVRAAKQKEEQTPDVFSLINSHLAAHALMINNDSSVKKQKGKEAKKEDRRSLIAYEEEMKELRVRVEKLEEMVNRNKKEKAVYDAAMRKLIETRKALSEAEAKHASASHAVVSKEKEKKWLRF